MKTIPELKSWEIERFWSNCTPVGECLEWDKAVNKGGRAMIHLYGAYYYASRVSYKLCFDQGPGNLNVCHTCDNGKCVNPNHLFLGDDKDNLSDMADKKRNCKPDETHLNATLTREQAEQILQDNGEHTDEYWAKKFGVKGSTINLLRNRRTYKHINAPSSPSKHKNEPKLNEDQVRKIRLSLISVSQRKLAKEYGVDKATISKIQKQESYHQFPWTNEELAMKDERSKKAKGRQSAMTAEQIELMLRLRSEGKTHNQIAAVLGISRARVSQLLKEHGDTL